MIFQANKQFSHQSQEGITLLLSVLLLSAITTIAFSLAAVGFAEITTSNDLARTEPILYHSLGVAEEAAFGMKRSVSSIKDALGAECASSFVPYTLDATLSISTKTKKCNVNSSKDVEVSVLKNTYATATRIYVYDPADSGTGSSGYTSIKFKKTTNNGGSVQLYICPLSVDCGDPTPPVNNTTGWTTNGAALAYNNEVSMPSPGVASEILLINSGTARDFVEVISEPKGLPYINKEAIEIQSSFGRLIRRLRVLVPTQ